MSQPDVILDFADEEDGQHRMVSAGWAACKVHIPKVGVSLLCLRAQLRWPAARGGVPLCWLHRASLKRRELT